MIPRGILLAALLAATGCTNGGHFTLLGYTTQPTYDPGICTVYVPIAQNVSFARGLEFELTKAVVRDIQAHTPLKVVSCRDHADTELEMKVANSRKAQVLQNPLNEVRDSEFIVHVEVVWRDLRPGHRGDILSNPRRYDPNELPLPGQPPELAPQPIPVMVTPTGGYQPELGGSTATALQQAIDKAAMQITAMMEMGW
jgi:hypothetical protein